jgi:hypothetical protein
MPNVFFPKSKLFSHALKNGYSWRLSSIPFFSGGFVCLFYWQIFPPFWFSPVISGRVLHVPTMTAESFGCWILETFLIICHCHLKVFATVVKSVGRLGISFAQNSLTFSHIEEQSQQTNDEYENFPRVKLPFFFLLLKLIKFSTTSLTLESMLDKIYYVNRKSSVEKKRSLKIYIEWMLSQGL